MKGSPSMFLEFGDHSRYFLVLIWVELPRNDQQPDRDNDQRKTHNRHFSQTTICPCSIYRRQRKYSPPTTGWGAFSICSNHHGSRNITRPIYGFHGNVVRKGELISHSRLHTSSFWETIRFTNMCELWRQRGHMTMFHLTFDPVKFDETQQDEETRRQLRGGIRTVQIYVSQC